MKEEMYAKSNPKISLLQHTNDVIDIFKTFLNLYPNKFSLMEQELILLACKYHDYGKVNTLFQEYMRTGKKPLKWLQHGFFSVCFLEKENLITKYGEEVGMTYYCALATSIFYHHTKKCPYLLTGKKEFREDYRNYVEANAKKYFKKETEANFFFHHLLFHYPCQIGSAKDVPLETWILYSKIKGMLNRCDYAASAGDSTMEEEPLINGKSIGDIVKKHYSSLRKSQIFVLHHQKDNLVLIDRTGSGKTEAALLWIGKEKGFYTLPLKGASTAIYRRIKKNYGYSKVSLLHSDALDILIDEKKEDNTIISTYQEYQKMKRLSYPLTICTIDQIFKFPFKSLGQEPFLATLSYSKVVIDEIQMYSSRILACLLIGLSMLVKAGGKFMIITATFPDLFSELLQNQIGTTNYIIENCAVDDTIVRHKIIFQKSDFNYKKIIESARTKKVLVICNSISKSIATYEELKRLDSNVTKGLLHSHFIKLDRNLLETKILSFDEFGIWVTSPIVEASLDIDFDELHTEMCSADSLLQRFGRCYRRRGYDKKKPNVYIYETGNTYIYDEEIYYRSIEKLIPYQNKLLSEQDKLCYLNEVYNKDEIKQTKYYKAILKNISLMEAIYPMKYEEEEVQNLFREMSSVSIIPEIVFQKNNQQIQTYIDTITTSNCLEDKLFAKKELLQYTLSIRYHYRKKNEFIEIPNTDLYRLKGSYHPELGFIEDSENHLKK